MTDGLKRERDNALAGLRETQTQMGVLQRKIDSLVAGAREQGASWQQVGDALGMSRQAAWDRFASRIGTDRAGTSAD